VRCLAHVIGDIATSMGGGVPAARDRATATVFKRATEILDAVLKIGNKANASGAAVVTRRMEAAKREPTDGDRSGKLMLANGKL
jgi:hypothetical protein